jgi:hypothetical protein
VSSRAKQKRERRASAKAPREGVLCAYCGEREGREGEHVFPRSWYPESTLTTVQYLKVPGCHECNQRWMQIEDEFRTEFLMVISPLPSEAKGLHDKFTRSINPSFADAEREKRSRTAKAMRILKSMKWVSPVPGGPQATVRTESGLIIRASPVRSIEKRVLNGMGEKLIRGLHYAKRAKVLPPLTVHSILIRAAQGEDPDLIPILQYLWTIPPVTTLAPGLEYRQHDQPGLMVWDFLVWGQVRFISFAKPADAKWSPH